MEENIERENIEQVEENDETQKKGRFYTDEEIELLKQKTGDKRIAQYQKTLEKRNREAEKLKNMSDSERHDYELNEREAAIEAKERELAMAENKAVATGILAEKGIDVSLVEFVVAEEADEMNRRIKALEKAFRASVKTEVEKRLGGNTPKSQTMDTSALTKEAFAKLTLSEKQKLFMTDRATYDALTH